MSKELLKTAFDKMKNMSCCSLQLIKIKSGKTGISYYTRECELTPPGKIGSFAHELADKYSKAIEDGKYASVDEYTGDIVGNVIYKLEGENALISEAYGQVRKELANPDTEGRINDTKFNAYMLLGEVELGSETVPIKFISMQSPMMNMKNKFWFKIERNAFREIDEPILNLKKSIDVVILKDTIYMLTLAGENLFAMERAYKAVCNNKVNEIIECGFLTDAAMFQRIATSGSNPRRFVSYNQSRLDAMKNVRKRKKLANMFDLKLRGNEIDTNDEKTSARLVKFLCNKAMLDPLDDSPVEVAAAKSWQ